MLGLRQMWSGRLAHHLAAVPVVGAVRDQPVRIDGEQEDATDADDDASRTVAGQGLLPRWARTESKTRWSWDISTTLPSGFFNAQIAESGAPVESVDRH